MSWTKTEWESKGLLLDSPYQTTERRIWYKLWCGLGVRPQDHSTVAPEMGSSHLGAWHVACSKRLELLYRKDYLTEGLFRPYISYPCMLRWGVLLLPTWHIEASYTVYSSTYDSATQGWRREMQTTRKKVITRVLGLTYAPCMDTYTNKGYATLIATRYGSTLGVKGNLLSRDSSHHCWFRLRV